jgi:hypothetical protein
MVSPADHPAHLSVRGDALQCPLVPRCSFRARLKRRVRPPDKALVL